MKTIYSICVVVSFSLFFLSAIRGQAPANNLCADAVEIIPASGFFCNLNSLSQSTQGATNSMELNPGCYEEALDGGDVWSFFFATESSHVIQYSGFNLIDNLGFPVSSLYSGDCGSLDLIGCDAGFQIRFDGLNPGTKYYLRTWLKSSNIGPSNFAEFDICVGKTTDCPAQEVIYVTEGGSGTGESWASSLGSLQDALAISCACTEISQIWVAEGMYYPDEGQMQDNNERNESFKLCSGVSVFGGFVGNETELNDRDPALNPTILSGDINQSGDSIGNSYTIVMNMNVNNMATLDGFVIKGANSDGGAPNIPAFVAGGILNYFSSLTIANCLLEENFGGNAAGGIYMLESSPNITNCTIRNNNVLNSGAGIFAFNSSPIIENSVFENNTANSFDGGGLAIINSNATVVISNTQVINNTAGGFGGGVIIANSSVDMEDCVVDDNISGSRGGGIYVDKNSIVNISSSEIKGNTATTLYGGGVYIDGVDGNVIGLTTVNISDSEISGNTAGQSGGGLISFGAISEIENCYFSMNTSEEQGGAMWIWQPSSLSIVNSNFENNSTGLDGGAIYYSQEFFGNPIEISGSVFTGNEAFSLEFPNGPPNITRGGALFIDELSEVSISDSDFSLNEAFVGGAIHLRSDLPTSIDNSTFTENTAINGGGIFCGGFLINHFELEISESTFTGNSASLDYAAAIHSEAFGIRIIDCTFNDNSSPDGIGAVRRVTSVIGSTFENNSGGTTGAIRDVDTIAGSVFINNTATLGASFGGAVSFGSQDAGFIEGSVFMGNSAVGDGGAVFGSRTVKNSVFMDNSSGNRGGATYFNTGGGQIINSIFGENSAGKDGGASYLTGSNNDIINSLFWGNTADEYGGGVHISLGSNKRIINSTFTENDAILGGGAISMFGTSEITNCIVWNNTLNGDANVPEASLKQITSGPTTFTNSLIAHSGGSFSWNTDFGSDNGGNLDVDPMFADPSSADFSLMESSPCINAGTPDTFGLNLPSLDLADNPRIEGDTIDMGAYEFSPPPPIECPPQEVLFVKKGETGEGSSWSDALGDLQDALWIACQCSGVSEIWVADGTYYPDEGLYVNSGDRDATFQLCNGVALYGGFAGNETELTQRDWDVNETILSGDINQSDSLDGNSYTVVNGSETDSTAVLDGFIVTMGNANGGGSFPNPNFRGGGMYIFSGSPLVSNCSFIDNSANWGGGIYIQNNILSGVNLVFQNNHSTNLGGGIFSGNADLILDEFLFENNTAVISGGGIYASGGESSFTNGSFIENSTGLTSNSNTGGGASLYTGVFHLENVVVSDNASRFGGGFLFSSSNYTLANCQFLNNSAVWGGGFDSDGATSGIVSNCIFQFNSAAFGGGTRIRNGQNVVFENCLFENNMGVDLPSGTDPGTGGGLAAVVNSEVEVLNSIFRGNTAFFAGGGITLSSNSYAEVKNCLIHNNESDGLAGGIDIRQSSAIIINSTITGNHAEIAGGLGLSSTSGTTDVSVVNSIVFDNHATDQYDNVGAEGADISFEYSIIEGSGGSADWDTDFGVDLGGNFDIDPQFADPSSDDFQLTECSPALDAGTPDTTGLELPTTDLEGNPRFVDALDDGVSRVDMGAYEFQSQGVMLEVECISSFVVYLDQMGDGSLNVNDLEPSDVLTVLESCSGGLDLTGGIFEFDCSDAGEMISLYITAVDVLSLRQDSCELMVEIMDTLSPEVVFCPISVDTTILEEGVTEAFFSFPPAGFSDACGVATIENNINPNGADASGTYGPGTTEVVITATDFSGNEAQCEFTVTVTVQLAITCPQNVISETNPGLCSAALSIDEATAFSIFQPVTIENDYNNGGANASDTYPVGTTVVTFTATDGNNDTESCTTSITVNDMEAPLLTCPQDVTVLIPEESGPVQVDLSLATATDNCDLDPAISNDQNSGGADASGEYSTGTTIIEFEAEDETGNTSTCTTNVTVEEVDALSINCPTTVVVSTDAGECNASITLTAATAVSGFPPVSIENDYNNGGANASDTYPVGTTVVTFTATDGNNDTESCTTSITVNDMEAPVLTCPQDVTVLIPEGSGPVQVDLSLATATDNCDLDPAISNDQNSGGEDASGEYSTGTTIIEFEAEDETGNTSTCTTNVTVEEVDALTINCPATVVVSTDAGECNASITLTAATAVSGFPPVTIENDYNNGGANASDTYPAGTTVVTFTAIDGNNDTESCTTSITVNDMEAPVLTCPQDVTVGTNPSVCFASLSLIATASDNCSIGESSNSQTGSGLDASGTFENGETEVEFFVADVNGLSASCTVVVTVVDDEAPQLACPANVTVMVDPGETEVDVVLPLATATDNCLLEGIENSYNDGGADASGEYGLGVTAIEFTATDATGLSSNCITLVEVIDILPLELNCPATITADTDMGQCGAVVALTAEVIGGLEPVEVSNSFNSGEADASGFYGPGVEQVVFNATAADGETVQCTTLVTVQDNEAPELNCSDTQIELSVSPRTISTADVVDVVSDNCNIESVELSETEFGCEDIGANAVTVTATDSEGNSSTCTVNVMVADNTAPTAVCNQIEVVLNTVLQTITPEVEELDGGSTDACGILEISADIPELSCADAGNIEIELTVTDNNGNTSSCMAEINVVCAANTYLLSGTIYREDGESVGGVKVDLSGFEDAETETGADGNYEFEVFGGTNAVIQPSKDTLPAQLVTTFDLVLMQRHILGIELLDSPYKIIASDASGDDLVSTFDMVLFQTLIVGIINELPVPSWRFIDANYEFENPSDPFGESFPEVIGLQAVASDMPGLDFVGVKMGYVKYNLNGSGSRERSGEPFAILLRQEGPDVVLESTENINLSGMSLSLQTNYSGASEIDDQLIASKGISSWHHANDEVLRYIWTSGNGADLNRGDEILRIWDANVEKVELALSDRLRSEAITRADEERPIHFIRETPQEDEMTLEVYPNPFIDQVLIGLKGWEGTDAVLEVVAMDGRLLSRLDVTSETTFPILLHSIPEYQGQLLIQLTTEKRVLIKKLIRLE